MRACVKSQIQALENQNNILSGQKEYLLEEKNSLSNEQNLLREREQKASGLVSELRAHAIKVNKEKAILQRRDDHMTLY